MSPAAHTLVAAVEAVAARFPDRIAVTGQYGELTYQALDQRADVLADQLIDMGAGPGQVVTLLAHDVELVVGIVGILKTGAAYLPVDPAYPAARVAWTIQHSGSRLAVSTSRASSTLDDVMDVLFLDRLPTRTTRRRRARPPIDPQDVAYVIYTSGSTGDPKGVEVTHHSVLGLFEATEDRFAFDEHDVWSMFHSAAFDFSVWEIWGALLFGGRLVLVSRDVARVPDALHQLLGEQRVTVLNQTPSAFRRLAGVDARSGDRLTALRLVVFGGERLDPATLRPWLDRYGDERPRLVNMYGITEAIVHASYRPMTRADLEWDGPSPIGTPLSGMRFHVLDADGAPVAPGTPGELFIESATLARGYLGRPDLTAERFLAGPSADGSTRLLRTGDKVVALPSGEYGYLGRVDDQLKIRGYRIEPGEIEAFLAGQPEVEQAVVVARDYGSDDVRLIAYVVAADDPDLLATLRERAAARLPQYLCPSIYIRLDALPLTINGKVDKALLPEPTDAGLGDEQADPSDTADRIAMIWRTVLAVPDVERDVDFFDLGGNSLTLLRMFAQVNSAFGADLDITVLIDGATVHALAKQVEAATTARGSATTTDRQGVS